MAEIPTITLNNGVNMPQVGLGVFQVPSEQTRAAVTSALEAGYRSIDTAAVYGNEAEVGEAIAQSGIARDELFVTTKLWNSNQGYDETARAFEKSLSKLGMDYVDLYLIHWPVPEYGRYRDTWRAFEKLHADGTVRAIGVSNFKPHHLDRLAESSDVVPAVNQIELHPYLQQAESRQYHAEHGIVTEAWAPIGQGGGLLEDATIARLADKHGRTPAQIVLRWHLQLGNVVIPKSVTPSRIRQNLDLFGFSLDDDDMAAIGGVNRDERIGPDPDTMNIR
ncbi:aldo/keto reductase [Haloechinothrix halophila]|uniref:aldo/keto reductase n=1 Tax=Haloechinothrix halophila TaxID=1069073 RepID=UPI0003FDC4CD|nr:aldo/keto reductase [Haloechinothrix halophila]